MAIRLKKLSKQRIVIIGATSGIGLVTARMASQHDAKVVIAARSDEALKSLANEIRLKGGCALDVAADVTNQDDLERVADTAVQAYGGFDTWVNNAGTSIYGETTDVPVERERKLFEVNYWGVVYGCRAAVRHLSERGGALINIGSVASDRAIPLQAAYSASKHAVKAYTDVLRSELEHRNAPISVTLIKPGAIDTPLFQHAETYMNAQPTEPSPMYAPEVVAEAILHAATHPVRDLLVGDMAPLHSALGRFTPRLGDRVVKSTMFDAQKSKRRPQPGDNEALDRPSGELNERGGNGAVVLERSLYTSAAMHPLAAGMLAAGAGLALAAMVRGSRAGKT